MVVRESVDQDKMLIKQEENHILYFIFSRLVYQNMKIRSHVFSNLNPLALSRCSKTRCNQCLESKIEIGHSNLACQISVSAHIFASVHIQTLNRRNTQGEGTEGRNRETGGQTATCIKILSSYIDCIQFSSVCLYLVPPLSSSLQIVWIIF